MLLFNPPFFFEKKQLTIFSKSFRFSLTFFVPGHVSLPQTIGPDRFCCYKIQTSKILKN